MSYSHYQGKNRSVLWLSRQPPQHELALLCILEKKLNPFQNAEGKPKLMAVNINRPDLGLFIFNMGIFEEQKLFYGGKCRSCKKCKMDGVVFVIYLFCAMPTLISAWQYNYNWNILNSCHCLSSMPGPSLSPDDESLSYVLACVQSYHWSPGQPRAGTDWARRREAKTGPIKFYRGKCQNKYPVIERDKTVGS